jgi:hypothetical protein
MQNVSFWTIILDGPVVAKIKHCSKNSTLAKRITIGAFFHTNWLEMQPTQWGHGFTHHSRVKKKDYQKQKHAGTSHNLIPRWRWKRFLEFRKDNGRSYWRYWIYHYKIYQMCSWLTFGCLHVNKSHTCPLMWFLSQNIFIIF